MTQTQGRKRKGCYLRTAVTISAFIDQLSQKESTTGCEESQRETSDPEVTDK